VCYQGPVAAAVKTFKYKGRMYGLETFAALTRQFYMYHPPAGTGHDFTCAASSPSFAKEGV
jgi:hypothetical protein